LPILKFGLFGFKNFQFCPDTFLTLLKLLTLF
jgi:hypothetical protein